jgi:hypothetical protein
MSAPLWVVELASAFWDEAGGAEPFPRTLRDAIDRAPFELTVKELPALTVRAVEDYLAGLGVPWGCGVTDRPLRACLAAEAGVGFVFLDAEDAAAERTFSLAHELAHFLRHHRQPRRQAGRRLGEGVAEVLDGLRRPTPAERLRALLADVSIGCHVHLMERGRRRQVVTAEVARAEEEADRLAYELLAPAAAVLARGRSSDPGSVAGALRARFGLPAGQAEAYARLLLARRPEDPLLRRLRGPS